MSNWFRQFRDAGLVNDIPISPSSQFRAAAEYSPAIEKKILSHQSNRKKAFAIDSPGIRIASGLAPNLPL